MTSITNYTVIDPQGRTINVESVKTTESSIVVGWFSWIMCRIPFPIDSALVYNDRVVYHFKGYQLVEKHL